MDFDLRPLKIKGTLPQNLVLDNQFADLPKEVIFCRNCVVSNQRPRTTFNDEGICSACLWAREKDQLVDWEKREKELQALCDKFRRNDGSYDVIVPGSGGKDSAFVAHQLKHRYGMNPLCVTWAPFEHTTMGFKNLEEFVRSGFNNVMCQPDGDLHRRLSRLTFDLKGDAFEPFVFGQKSFAFHIAAQFGVSLIMYGENGEVEYGGSHKYKEKPFETPAAWEEEYFKGTSVDRLAQEGLKCGMITKQEIDRDAFRLYKPPHPEVVKKLGIQMHWFSYYQKWTPQENFYYAVTHTGFNTNPEGRSEGTYTKYASIDDKADGYHFYLGYMKFGLGRTSRDAQQDIRRHHITREEGVALVKRYDGELPQRHLKWFLQYLDISEDHFWAVMDKFREKSNVWEKVGGKWKMPYIVT